MHLRIHHIRISRLGRRRSCGPIPMITLLVEAPERYSLPETPSTAAEEKTVYQYERTASHTKPYGIPVDSELEYPPLLLDKSLLTGSSNTISFPSSQYSVSLIAEPDGVLRRNSFRMFRINRAATAGGNIVAHTEPSCSRSPPALFQISVLLQMRTLVKKIENSLRGT